MKFHLTPSGQARKCIAEPGNCRYGENGIDPIHYSTKEEAQAAYEKTMTKDNFTTLKKNTKITTLNEEQNQTLTNSMIEEYEEMIKHLTTSQENALLNYTFTLGTRLNRMLRGKMRDNENDEYTIETDKIRIKTIDEIMEKFGQGNGVKKHLYRFMKIDKNVNVEQYISEMFQNGEEFTDKGYMSTTEDISFIATYTKKYSHKNYIILDIETDKGISLQKDQETIGHLQSFEKERLLPRDMTFEVQDKTQTSIKIDKSRQKLLHQFSRYYSSEDNIINSFTSKRFHIISLTEKMNEQKQ